MNEQIKPQVTVVDSIMGSGKTTATIQMINRTDDDTHFLYITPYLDEVKRVIDKCSQKRFKQPQNRKGSKMDDVRRLINKGENIVSTHALFKRFNQETIELAYINNYILIMDEVADVVDIYTDRIYDGIEDRTITREDVNTILEKYATVDPDTKLLIWTDDSYPDNGVFGEIKKLSKLESLTVHNDTLFLWLFPVKVFQAFKKVYILTYLFDSQVQKYYYDLFNIKYEKKAAKQHIGTGYKFIEYSEEKQNINNINYKELINIVDNEKMNMIGEFEYTLSTSWYKKASKETLGKLKKNMLNFFMNISKTKSNQNIWTTFKDYKTALSGKGYTKGFVPLNARATNEYRECTAVAYTVNRYLNPNIKTYFTSKGIEVDEDEYALSEMLQFIWRSAIREGNPITVYVPSKRMRDLLQSWIEIMTNELEN